MGNWPIRLVALGFLAAAIGLAAPARAGALHDAARAGDLAAARSLLEAGADVQAEDGADLITALHVAAQGGFPEIAELLIGAGAKVNARSREGYTPLHAAAMAGHVALADLLIARGAEVSAVSRDGSTPLHFAAFAGSAEIVDALLKAGASTTTRDLHGETPADLARSKGFDAIAEAAKPIDTNPTPSIYRDGTAAIERRLAAMRAASVQKSGAAEADVKTAEEPAAERSVASSEKSGDELLAAAETVLREMKTDDPAPATRAAPPPPAAPTASANPPAVAPDYAVQLASIPNRERAEAEWLRLRKVHAGLLGRLAGEVVEANLGENGVRYRVRGGPLGLAEARALCQSLKAAKQDCLVVRR